MLSLALLVGGRGVAAQPLAPLDEYRLRAYGHAEGLSSVFVHRIQRGGDGYLYVLNEGGVARFDGESFERIPTPGLAGAVSGWRKDTAGRLWVRARSGASGVIDGGRFRRVPAFGQTALSGGASMNAFIASKVLRMFTRYTRPTADYGLTDREREILHLLVEEHTQKEVAEALFLSPHTVDTHLRNIYAKLQVHSRTGAVAKALRERLL